MQICTSALLQADVHYKIQLCHGDGRAGMLLSWDFVLSLESNYNPPAIASGKAGTAGAAAEAGCSGMLPGLVWTRLIFGCGFLAPPGSRTGRGTGVCLPAGLQTLPCSSAARKSFLLSAEHQLTGRMLELPFLALPKFILPRAVVVYF